jgi:hypothetical protein
VKVDSRLISDQHEDTRETIVDLKHPETNANQLAKNVHFGPDMRY